MLDLYRNEGNGDVFPLAVAVVETDIAAGQLFGDRWVIATDDRGPTANAARWNIPACSSAQLAEVLNRADL